ncbi:MAG TPA: type II toxin-antitoxin system VapC family toxin [Burkholderiales bacterium]|nr:type II toxin-antitoxin system VapC family toxin [Burkholderiales bacterium]
MRVLLDTHALLWWLTGDERLSARALQAIKNARNTIWVSPASGWELATKFRLGKLPGAERILPRLPALIEESRLRVLPITFAHALKAGALDNPHRDPFDRMLTAQAMIEDLVLLTSDPACVSLGAKTIW